ncbi:Galectin [Aphelenchoides fujianensis]|nr:Galectin [Aphelenchoides fujianensis]
MVHVTGVDVPFHAHIKHGLPDGVKFELEGEARWGFHKQIWFELKAGHHHIPLHINIRMGGDDHKHQVVVNSSHDGNWGSEKHHHTHIHPGTPIHIHVKHHDGKYEIRVNDEEFHFHPHSHHLSPSHIDALEIRGDLWINRLEVHHDHDGHVHLHH